MEISPCPTDKLSLRRGASAASFRMIVLVTAVEERVTRRSAGKAGTVDAGDVWLWRAALVFALAVLVHNSDHLRRGADVLSADLFWLGTLGILLEVAIVIVICARHRYAPLAALVGGVVLASGYVEAHFLPAHRWFSDSFTNAVHVSPLSWFAASLEVAAATGLAIVGLMVLRRRGGGLRALGAPHPEQRTLAAAVTDPLVLAFTACQVVILVISFAQR